MEAFLLILLRNCEHQCNDITAVDTELRGKQINEVSVTDAMGLWWNKLRQRLEGLFTSILLHECDSHDNHNRLDTFVTAA
jgi:hypothetical protein